MLPLIDNNQIERHLRKELGASGSIKKKESFCEITLMISFTYQVLYIYFNIASLNCKRHVENIIMCLLQPKLSTNKLCVVNSKQALMMF